MGSGTALDLCPSGWDKGTAWGWGTDASLGAQGLLPGQVLGKVRPGQGCSRLPDGNGAAGCPLGAGTGTQGRAQLAVTM